MVSWIQEWGGGGSVYQNAKERGGRESSFVFTSDLWESSIHFVFVICLFLLSSY